MDRELSLAHAAKRTQPASPRLGTYRTAETGGKPTVQESRREGCCAPIVLPDLGAAVGVLRVNR